MPFLAVIWAVVRPFAFKLALILVGVVTVLAVIARIKHAGRMQERVEAMERTIKVAKRRTELEHETRNDLRRSGERASDRLRRDWSRD